MKCNNCGFDNGQDFTFCPGCGTQASAEQTTCANPSETRLLTIFKDKLFFVLCVCMSVSFGASLLAGNFNLLALLGTIFIWLVYSNSQKGIVDTKNMRNLSGLAYATYVLCIVLIVLFLIVGVLLCAVTGLLGELTEVLGGVIDFDLFGTDMTDEILSMAGWVFGVIFILFALVSIILSIGYRKIHKFAKSAYTSVLCGNVTSALYGNDNPFVYAASAKKWMWVFGVIAAIDAVSTISTDILSAVDGGCDAAVFIIAAILVKKHILSNTFTPTPDDLQF